MNLNLTCGSYERMTDTNKLLYLILGELVKINMPSASVTSESGLTNAISPDVKENASQSVTEPLEEKEGHTCKYCGEFIEGNMGNLLAHIKKCPERAKGSV